MLLLLLSISFLSATCSTPAEESEEIVNPLSFSVEALTVSSEKQTENITVEAKSEWGAYPQSDWIKVSPSGGVSGSTTVRVAIAENKTGDVRQSSIEFRAAGKSYTLPVKQNYDVEAVSIADSKFLEALVAAHDTDGDGIVEKNGTKASFNLYYPPDYLDRQSLSLVFSEQAKEIGIEVTLVGADWDTIYANMYSSAALMQQTSPDPYKSIYQQYHSKEVDGFYMNPNLYNNSASDALMEQAMHSNDFNQANNYWSQSALVNGGGWGPAGDAPWVWLANYDYHYFIKDGINIGNQPDGLGNDILINICEWTRA